MRLSIVRLLWCLLAVGLGAPLAFSQTYPSKPIRLLVPYPSGTGTDVVARAIGRKLSESLGQPVVVDNRTGAAGGIATEAGARAAPDGYTLLMSDVGALTINPAVYAKLPYDTVKDLIPIVEVAFVPVFLVVHPDVPARSLQEFLVVAKQKPGQFTFGTPGVGSLSHLVTESLKAAGGIDLVHVPYKGATPALVDLAGGQISMAFASEVSTRAFVQAGKMRALAIAAQKRSPTSPDVPTMAEAGLPGFVGGVWMGILAPAGTSEDIVLKLNTEINRILRLPDVAQQLSSLGVEIIGGSPQQFSDHIKQDLVKWSNVVKSSGVKLE